MECARYEDAFQDALQCIEIDPSSTLGYSLAAAARKGSSKTEDAIDWIRRAIVVNPKDGYLFQLLRHYTELAYVESKSGKGTKEKRKEETVTGKEKCESKWVEIHDSSKKEE